MCDTDSSRCICLSSWNVTNFSFLLDDCYRRSLVVVFFLMFKVVCDDCLDVLAIGDLAVFAIGDFASFVKFDLFDLSVLYCYKYRSSAVKGGW